MPETKTKIETDTDQLTIESDTDKTKIESDTEKIETCNMHTLVYPTYLLRPPLAPGARRIPESREIPELKRKKKIETRSKEIE
jgi:hypothetical protein